MQDNELKKAIESISKFNYNPFFQLELLELKISRLHIISSFLPRVNYINDIQSLLNLYCHIYNNQPISSFKDTLTA